MAKDTPHKAMAERLRSDVNKELKREAVRTISSSEELLQVDSWIEMPQFFKKATGGLGFPAGHMTQIVGESDTGKTTLLMEGMVRTQKAGGLCYLIDTEHKFSFERFKQMGGVPEDVEVMSADYLEDAWTNVQVVTDKVLALRKTYPDVPVFLAWDSLAASVPRSIAEAEAEDKHMSVEAKINNAQIRKLRKPLRDSKVTAVFVNHTYQTMPKFGISQEILKGGKEMFYLSTLIVKTKRRSWCDIDIDTMKNRIGAHCLLEVFKGHLGGNRPTTEFWTVSKGILESEMALKEYKESIKLAGEE